MEKETSLLASLFSAKGRIKRSRYWAINLCCGLIIWPLSIITDVLPENMQLLFFIIYIPILWIVTVTCIKRLHDLGYNGWLVLLSFIPLLNIAIGIFMGFFKGNESDNKYGPSPYPTEKVE